MIQAIFASFFSLLLLLFAITKLLLTSNILFYGLFCSRCDTENTFIWASWMNAKMNMWSKRKRKGRKKSCVWRVLIQNLIKSKPSTDKILFYVYPILHIGCIKFLLDCSRSIYSKLNIVIILIGRFIFKAFDGWFRYTCEIRIDCIHGIRIKKICVRI